MHDKRNEKPSNKSENKVDKTFQKVKQEDEEIEKEKKRFLKDLQETPYPNKRNSRGREQRRLKRNNLFFEENFSKLKEFPQ